MVYKCMLQEFVVGKPETFMKQSSIRELTIIEQQANNTVDEINNLEEKIKILMQVKTKFKQYK